MVFSSALALLSIRDIQGQTKLRHFSQFQQIFHERMSIINVFDRNVVFSNIPTDFWAQKPPHLDTKNSKIGLITHKLGTQYPIPEIQIG